jgi:hypothetical protein
MDVAAGAVADQQSGSPHSDAGLLPSHVSIYLPGRNTSTEESALNLASISAQRTGGVTDFDFESAASLKDVNANALVIGRADFLSSKDRALASLSAYSVAPHSDALFVTSDSASKAPAALLASDETSLAQAVETLRQLAHWRVAKTGPVTRFSADGEVTGLPRAIPAPAEQVAVLGLEPWQFAALLAVLAVTALWSITALLNEQQNKRLAGSEA